eukprot:TRINITY_DN9978_c0_g1_i2.p2 TRINITY_DN9978_c0_g1~~TRINITY_DN9978_c0_g1_i2.p2  ORF type:complete len:142 (-),score=19.42 TRINITY_DN9978_c0_g1_i2:55-480(-)
MCAICQRVKDPWLGSSRDWAGAAWSLLVSLVEELTLSWQALHCVMSDALDVSVPWSDPEEEDVQMSMAVGASSVRGGGHSPANVGFCGCTWFQLVLARCGIAAVGVTVVSWRCGRCCAASWRSDVELIAAGDGGCLQFLAT